MSDHQSSTSALVERHRSTGFRSVAEIIDGMRLSNVVARYRSEHVALNPVSLGDVYRLEPRAKALVERARHLESCHFYGHPYGVNSLWKELKTYAGWYAAEPDLQGSAAYEVLFDAVWDAVLPGECIDCRASAGEFEE